MELYSLLREFADSWALLSLFTLFVLVILWAFRPGTREVHADISQIPFRHDDRPAPPAHAIPSDNEGQK
ncbi:MAG: cbb3-type cytochrome c oxidase subunit 3 [Paracoccaceae bacterium]